MTSILVVDDNQTNLYMLQVLLTANGFEVEQASNGAEALVLAHRTPPDLLVSDILMPVMDGFTLCRTWMKDKRLKNIPFIFYTATYTDPKDEALALSLGADRFVVKPMEPDKFLALLKETLVSHKKSKPVNSREALDETQYLKEYSAALIRKLEDKVLQLEEKKHALELDVLERKRAEKQIQESEAKYRSLVEQIPAIVYLSPFPGSILKAYISPYIKKLGGYDPEQMAIRGTWREIIHPDDLPRLTKKLEQAIQSGETVTDEFRVFTRDKRQLWVQETYWTVRDGSGQPLYLQGIVLDVTERKQAEEEIRKLNSELEQRVEERTRELRSAQEELVRQENLAVLGRLAGNIGHELRNPLGIINNAVYYLRLIAPQADDKVKEYMTIIESEVRAADKIISDLLDFSGIKIAERERLGAVELIERSLVRFPPPGNVSVKLALPDDLPDIFVDRHQITQVFCNLVENAYQAMPGGGKLIIAGTQMGKEVAISIKDTGVGISPEIMDRLFEPLFTTRARGMGLGLPVGRKLVEINGGRIEVHSKPGKGSTFTVRLPVMESD